MQTTKYTFWKLINDYRIDIPIIQRDYAQGRNVDKIPEIRRDFLKSLYNAINNEKTSLDFDFVYGSVEENGSTKKLLPLDGQQRLTTLFLLHWYLANKEGKINEIKGILSRFSYETRITSRDFCFSLIEKGVDFKDIDMQNNDAKISDLIKDACWFYMSWAKDPTIKAMLVMLDDIHKEFKNTENCFEKLKRDIDSNPPVTFRFLELENFGLTDNLYIKMNARGKSLTDFENFKAKFSQILNEYYPEKLLNYSMKIDNGWTDIFWKYKETKTNTIDNPFMRYMYFITEMLYVLNTNNLYTTSPFVYGDNSVPRINYELIKDVYSNKENIEFFMDSLDFWTSIAMEPDDFMSKIFAGKYTQEKVVIFDGKSNLWSRCLTGEAFGIAEKILLFSLIKHCVTLNNYSVTIDLVDYLRVVRNLLMRVRQAINTKYISNLRFEFMKKQVTDISKLLIENRNVYQIITVKDFSMTGFAKDALESEVEKGKLILGNPELKEIINKLEDNYLLRGCLDNLLEIVKENPTLDLNSEIINIWANNNSLIIKALLTVGDYSVTIGHSALGTRKYFGNKDEWNLILTRTSNESDRIKKVLKLFINKYMATTGAGAKQRLENMIQEYMQNTKKDWRYYFIKYNSFIDIKKNIFAWKNEYEIRKLNGNSLLAYHINPYVKEVAGVIVNKNICDVDECYGIYSDASSLNLKNGVILENLKDGWKVCFPDNYTSKNNNDEFNKLIAISSESKQYWLKETTDKDRVGTAIDFINSLGLN